jgi:hypothetical protein
MLASPPGRKRMTTRSSRAGEEGSDPSASIPGSAGSWDEGEEGAAEQRTHEHRRSTRDGRDETVDRSTEGEVLRGQEADEVAHTPYIPAIGPSGHEGEHSMATHIDAHGTSGEFVLTDRPRARP